MFLLARICFMRTDWSEWRREPVIWENRLNLNNVSRLNEFLFPIAGKRDVTRISLTNRSLFEENAIKIIVLWDSISKHTALARLSLLRAESVTVFVAPRGGRCFAAAARLTHDINYTKDNEIKNYITEKYNYSEMMKLPSHPYQRFCRNEILKMSPNARQSTLGVNGNTILIASVEQERLVHLRQQPQNRIKARSYVNRKLLSFSLTLSFVFSLQWQLN